MSEPPKITSVEKTKNPRRVEAGRKLAAISKQAKAKKAQLKAEETKDDVNPVGEYSNLAMVFAGTIVIGAIALHFSRKTKDDSGATSVNDKPEEPKPVYPKANQAKES